LLDEAFRFVPFAQDVFPLWKSKDAALRHG
jgi:hypothetical protein